MKPPAVSRARFRNTIRSPVTGWTSGLSSVPKPVVGLPATESGLISVKVPSCFANAVGEDLDQVVGVLALKDERRTDLEDAAVAACGADQDGALTHPLHDFGGRCGVLLRCGWLNDLDADRQADLPDLSD